MFSENHPNQKQMFYSGADYDTDPFLVFSQTSGNFIDSHNIQVTSNDGNSGTAQKLRGESIYYNNTGNVTGYKCIGSIGVNDYVVEFWAPENDALPRMVRVNGVVVLSSVDFNISIDHPLRLHKSESSFNEVFAASGRGGVTPFVFDVKDMYDSVSTSKYFTAFDFKLYQINIQSSLDMPVFIGLENVGGGGGAPVGSYQYQIRYSSLSGDRTRWSHPTPMIPVVQSLSSDSREYPYIKTYGGPANPESVTSLAPILRFRVTNLYDYNFIEVKRIAYNQGAGIDFTPNGRIVYKRAIAPGELSVVDYVDFQESNADIDASEQDEVRELAHVKSAGAIRYSDRRIVLSDIEVESKVATPTFLTISSQTGFPVIDNLGKAGHKDPWNATYRKSEMRGEKAGFGVNFYDCVGNSGYVSKIDDLENYEFPNRRDTAASETQSYSLNGTPLAATTLTRNADNTHEVFDLADAVSKADKCNFKNIIQKGRVLGITGTKKKVEVLNPSGGVIYDCDETDAEIENHGTKVSLVGGLVSTGYEPFHPVGKNDSDVTGHNYRTNNKVSTEDIFTAGIAIEDGNVKEYAPKGFAPNYYSMGMLVAGITNIPEWAKSFAIVRTPSAGRVVCQGLGYYSMLQAKFNLIGNDNLGGKETKKMWFYAPDIDHGFVSSEVVNDIIANPSNYKLQFVSPLGFFSEYFSGEDNLVEKQRDRCVDMITYVRMLRDLGADPQINPGESSGFGGVGLDGYRYVDYEIFRNTGSMSSAFTNSADKGNRYFDISGVVRKAEGRGNYLEIEATEDFYATVYPGADSESNFGDAGNKNWTEPVYIINIVRTGANIKENEIQKYAPTSHYQKVESIIGKSTGQLNQVFPLVDERWEDCIPAPNDLEFGYASDRYIYVKKPDGTVQKWLNVTYKAASVVTNIVNSILFTGSYLGSVHGVYTHTNVDGLDRFFEINFNVSGGVIATTPTEGSIIMVRYDSSAPIRVFGGDTYIGEAIFAPIDRQAAATDEAENQFAFGNGLPYKTFKINPRYYTIRKAGDGANSVQDQPWFTLGYIRQLCAMFTVESRACLPYAYNGSSPNEFFPMTNYIIRPNRWDVDKSLVENYIFSEYGDDYGSEKDNWKWGGFRFKQQVNPDYSISAPVLFFSKPEFGFTETTYFPNRTMWTLQRPLNVNNAPGLKTFPANNAYDIDDGRGAIKFLWTDITEKGENIYALTERGICILLTKKSTLTDINGGNIGYMATTDKFVGQEYWLSKSIGIPDEMWRGVCEGYLPISGEDGSEVLEQGLFFFNRESAFRLLQNRVTDIGRIKYHSRIYPFIRNISTNFDTHIVSVFDNYTKHLYIHINDAATEKVVTFTFNQKNNRWTGTNSIIADKFTTIGSKIFSHKNSFETYQLNSGYELDGEDIESWVITCHTPEGTVAKEFIRVGINSYTKPTSVEFLKEKTGTVQCDLTASQIKNYVGYEAYVPRIKSSVNADRPRFQEDLIFTKIYHNLAEDFKLVDVEMQFKKIRK